MYQKNTPLLQNARISAKSAKSSAQRGRMFRRPSKPAKSTVFRIPTQKNTNSMSTKSTKTEVVPIKYTPYLFPNVSRTLQKSSLSVIKKPRIKATFKGRQGNILLCSPSGLAKSQVTVTPCHLSV